VIATCRESLTAMILFAVFLAVAIIAVRSGAWEATLRERARIMQSSSNRPDTGTQRGAGRLMVSLIVVGLGASAAARIPVARVERAYDRANAVGPPGSRDTGT
jgi:hypothetical protein